MGVSVYAIRIIALVTNLLASVVLTLHVIFLHDHVHGDIDDPVISIATQRNFLIAMVAVFIVSFVTLMLGDAAERRHLEKRLVLVENRVRVAHPDPPAVEWPGAKSRKLKKS